MVHRIKAEGSVGRLADSSHEPLQQLLGVDLLIVPVIHLGHRLGYLLRQQVHVEAGK